MVACLGAVAMALALPKTNLYPLAPVGAAACFWAWYGLTPKRAFWTGWAAGTLYFSLTFSWFGETAGQLIAPFGFLMTLLPAIGDGFFEFALAGLTVAWLAAHVRTGWLPLGAAAAFALAEWLRCAGLGPFDVPFATLSLSQVEGPLALLAAYGGSFGLTFVLALLGAEVALVVRAPRAGAPVRGAALAALVVLVATFAAWTDWPARRAPLPSMRVAAVQGNIPQSIKHDPRAILTAIRRYETMTAALSSAKPSLVLWPETVIPVDLTRSPALGAAFAGLARSIGGELAVGTLQRTGGRDYNALVFYAPTGAPDGAYQKHELVPFAEALPFAFLEKLPYANLIGRFARGETDGVTRVAGPGGSALGVGPLICWESAFSDHAVADARAGADVLLVATDDAWFGTTAGPYQHAQIAQMRAIETGRWVLRAASTGISGIIAPDGRFTAATRLNEQTTLTGVVGAGVPTLYDRLGSPPLALAFALLIALAAFAGRTRRQPGVSSPP